MVTYIYPLFILRNFQMTHIVIVNLLLALVLDLDLYLRLGFDFVVPPPVTPIHPNFDLVPVLINLIPKITSYFCFANLAHLVILHHCKFNILILMIIPNFLLHYYFINHH